MKSYKRLVLCVGLVVLLGFVLANLTLAVSFSEEESRRYLVEVGKLARMMEGRELSVSASDGLVDLSFAEDALTLRSVKRVYYCEGEEDLAAGSIYESCVRMVDGKLYRFCYESESNKVRYFVIVNLIMLGISVVLTLVLVYVYAKIIRPLHRLENLPYELSKGNLAVELPEEKTKYFGKFIWGTNMLRDSLEERRKRELALQRDKKMLLLSLAHDIKTPLSVIKLNAQALEKNLYSEEDRRLQAARDIHAKADELERYVSDMVSATSDDFLDLSVVEEEFYLRDLVEKLEGYYRDKLSVNHTEFEIAEYKNCLLAGDFNRLFEVLQNLMENALKYGDGKKISLLFEEEQDCELITVVSTGEPMRSEEIIKVFDSFFRGSNVKSKEGSGLGLYICRQLMTGMNGDIYVRQTKEAFYVTLVVRRS